MDNMDYMGERAMAKMWERVKNLVNGITSITGNAGSATKLQTARALEGVAFDGSAARHHYGTCSTSGSTNAKTCSITGFSLVTGARVIIRFSYANTAENPTLNVSSTGAKSIRYRGSAIPTDYIKQYDLLEFVYNGSYWYLVGHVPQEQIDELKEEIDQLLSPTALSTASIYMSATQTWKYTALSGLSGWKEVRMYIEVGDGQVGWYTFTRDKNTVAVSAYFSSSYYATLKVLCDFDNDQIGVYVANAVGWGLSTLKVTRIEGVVKN